MSGGISGDRLRGMLDKGAMSIGVEDVGAEAVALAIGGEGAAELEATAPAEGTLTTVIPPLSEAGRDELRHGIRPELPHVGIHHLIAGPDGQMISGSN